MRVTGYDDEASGTTQGDTLEVNAWRGSALLVAALDVVDWTLGWDASRQVQGQGTFTIADPSGTLAPWGMSDALAPGGTRLQVTWVSGLTGTRVPLGWWRIRSANPHETWRLVPSQTPTATVQPVAHTNLATNPSMETAAGTVAVRTNYATNPAVTAYTSIATLFGINNTRWFGGNGQTGTHTLVTGAADGPPGTGITTYSRKAWTAPIVTGNNGDTGMQTNNWNGFVPGQVYSYSCWLRANYAGTGRQILAAASWNDAVSNNISRHAGPGPAVAAPAGVWVRATGVVTAPSAGTATGMALIFDGEGGPVWQAGESLDCTGLLVEAVGTVGVVQRTNWVPNASFERNTTGWTAAGTAVPTLARVAGTGQSGTAYLRMTTTGTTAAAAWTATIPVTAGEQFAASAYVRGVVGRQVQVRITWSNAATTLSTTMTIASATNWQRVSVTGTVPAGVTTARVDLLQMATGTLVGDITDWDAVLYERGTNVVGVYFDGSLVGVTNEFAWTGTAFASASVQRALPTGYVGGPWFSGASPAPDPDLTVAWSGAANASTSVVRGAGVATATNSGSTRALIQSGQWHASGAKSLRIIGLSPTVNDTYASPGGDLGGIRLGLEPGKTYTALATLRLTGPLTGSTVGLAARLVAFTRVGTAAYVNTPAPAPPNLAGVYTQRVTFTMPSAPSEAFIRLYGGATAGNGEVWWDDFLVVEGDYTGPYFDGSTPGTTAATYAWTGAAHASTSTMAPVVVTYASTVLRVAGGGAVQVNADEETATVVMNRLDAEVVTAPTVLAEVTRLLRDIMPVTTSPAITDTGVPGALVYGDSRMDAVEDLLAVVNATHRMAGDGSLEVVPTAGVGPVWTLAGGDAGVLVELVRSLSDEGVYNAVVSNNETPDGQPLVGRSYLRTGPLAWGGPFGQVPLFHKAVATDASGVQADATTTLANRQASGEVDLAVTCLAHPGLQPHDRVVLVAPTVVGESAITGRVVRMTLASAGSASGTVSAKAMALAVRVSTNDLEAIASQVRRG